jgi:hypothetical protein
MVMYRDVKPHDGKLSKAINSYQIKLQLIYLHGYPVLTVDLVDPITFPGTYTIRIDSSKTLELEVRRRETDNREIVIS